MELKERLYSILVAQPRNIKDIAQEIGINHWLLSKFLQEENKSISFLTQLKIEHWIQRKERELE